MVIPFPESPRVRHSLSPELVAQRIRFLLSEPSVAAIIRARRLSPQRRAVAITSRVRELEAESRWNATGD